MNKKAQEEMVGLVAVILVVTVIFLIFLGIFLRGGSSEITESFEVSQFLDSAMEFTTPCTFNDYSYLNLQDLIKRCYTEPGRSCNPGGGEPGKNVCELAKDTITGITESAWRFDANSPTKGYSYDLVFLSDTGTETPVGINNGNSEINKGQTTGAVRGSEQAIQLTDGKITLSLKIYT